MRRAGCEAEILRALAAMPFIDRMDLAAVSGWSRGAVYEGRGQAGPGRLLRRRQPRHRPLSRHREVPPHRRRAGAGWPPRKRCPWTSCSAPTQSRPTGGAS